MGILSFSLKIMQVFQSLHIDEVQVVEMMMKFKLLK